jgi:DNA mismatch repair protein MutL
MTEEEAHLALQRHATSKLTDADDLAAIETLGFRGEALPTIARVSRMTLSARAAAELGGTQIEVAGGAIISTSPVGRPPGTTVTVANLFFNTPARRKFLQSPRSEMRAVSRTVTSYALARPGVHFLLSHDDRELLNLPPAADLRTRAAALYDPEVVERLLDVTYISELVEIEGLVGNPDLHRSSRDQQTFLVGGRWIQNPLLSHAVRTAFRHRMPSGRFPVAVLQLRFDPGLVDVNVHPTKREVKFARERQVYGAVVRAVEGALREFSPRLGEAAFVLPERTLVRDDVQMTLGGELVAREGVRPPSYDYRAAEEAVRADESPGERDTRGMGATSAEEVAKALGDMGRERGARESVEKASAWGDELAHGELVPLWQLHATYIFCPVKGGALVVDQHVAHERILYERALRWLKEREATSQALIFPETIDLPPAEVDQLEEALPGLERLGFDLRISGPRSVTVHGVPPGLERWERGAFLVDLLETLISERDQGAGYEEAIAASYACHAAIRKGDVLTLIEMNRLIEDLFACEVPESCPHGRPIIVKMPLDELDRRFGRG